MFDSPERRAAKKLKKFEEYLSKEKEYLDVLTKDISEEYVDLLHILDNLKDLKNLCLSILNRLTEVNQRMSIDIDVGDTIAKWKSEFKLLKEELGKLETKSKLILDQEEKESTVELLIRKLIQKAEKTIYDAEKTEKEWFK
ncbi:MAG: hypothetical protein QXG00_01590 [Candidatus Woesearchaeota archaeon]